MRMLKLLAVLALCLSLAAPTRAADKAKKGAKPFTGVVTEIKKDSDKDTGTIKIKVQNKKAANGPLVEATFTVKETTKFEKVAGKVKKKAAAAATGSPAKFSDLAKDAQVAITADGASAGTVKILGDAKKKKKKAK